MHLAGRANHVASAFTMVVILFGSTVTSGLIAPGYTQATDQTGSQGGITYVPDPHPDDPSFVALKEANRVTVSPSGHVIILSTPLIIPAGSTSGAISGAITQYVVEPAGTSSKSGSFLDDKGAQYQDRNYWDFCGPGSAAVALYYFSNTQSEVTGMAGSYYQEPTTNGDHANTFWWSQDYLVNPTHTATTYGRSLIFWLAMEQIPTGEGSDWAYPGIMDWRYTYTSPDFGTPFYRIRDIVNWEVSGRTTTSGFYVLEANTGSIPQSDVVSHVKGDIAAGHATIVGLTTYVSSSIKLPNWAYAVGHAIAIVAWNDTTQQFTYMDTCGNSTNCGSSTNGGFHYVSYSTMTSLINHFKDSHGNWDGGIIW